MGLLWPSLLLLLSIIPILIVVYVWILRRRKRLAVRYSSLWLIRAARPGRSHWRRHLPFVLFLLALSSLIMALSRPVGSMTVPSSRATIMLALDVSLSMCASDIPPNRLTVAQEAAETFIRNQEPGTQIGIVAFAGFAELIVPPTTDRDVLLNAVRNLTAARRTAIGSAILRSLDAISEVNEAVAPVNVYIGPGESEPAPVPEGTFQPDIIVLLTDGASNSGALPVDAAQAALDRGVRVYTIGFGTSEGLPFRCTEEQLGGVDFGFGGLFSGGGIPGSSFGSGGGNFGPGGGRWRFGLDEVTLQQVAAMTDAEYYLAESADELLDVFANVPTYLNTTKITTEISVTFTALGTVLALIAVALTQLWYPLP
jgi:Ca-activated chloride channel family protein